MSRLVLLLALAVATAACEKTTHDNIDKWRGTTKGPKKLENAVKDGDLDADLRAHAAQALVSIDKGDVALDAIRNMPDEPRAGVLDKLVPRLWQDAKPASDLDRPTKKNEYAKDALFRLRELATLQQREVIDGYLVDWLGGFYEGRVSSGRVSGEIIVRSVGPRMGPKLIASAREILKNPTVGDRLLKVTDDLLKGLALSGSPEAVGLLLDMAEKPLHPDETVGVRAMGALNYAYNEYEKPQDPQALVPHLDRLARLAAAEDADGRNVNVAFELLARAGKPHCIKPIATLVGHKDDVRVWQGVQAGLRCAGVEAIVPMAEALPQDRKLPQGILEKYFWDKAVALGPAAAGPARTLLGSASWVGRITGVHLLARLGTAADADDVRKLAGDKAKLKGWWGKKDPTGKKPDPTLGSEASSVADLLEKKR